MKQNDAPNARPCRHILHTDPPLYVFVTYCPQHCQPDFVRASCEAIDETYHGRPGNALTLTSVDVKPAQSQHKASTKPAQSQHKASTKPAQSQHKANHRDTATASADHVTLIGPNMTNEAPSRLRAPGIPHASRTQRPIS
ncbi:hypothetical protein [Cupriavidus campinensis]|uniref:hypothetical protein n=1 Tax=Cupriavidus campinensis TaxID=151783 RepID=UPI0016568678|nr:hypothetical protein [Cupriavidus campinensis]